MTAPREILPGRTYLVTRRCTQRQYLLRPDEKTNEIFEYCLAEAASRHGIGLIAWCAMSNHYHAVVHDPSGKLPAFLEHLHKMLARVLNSRWKRWENLWSSEQTCVTYLPTEEAIFEKVCYVLANPTVDGLVDRLADWPGSTSYSYLDGRTKVIARPRTFFRADGAMPETIHLATIQPPQSAASGLGKQWASRVRDELAEKERVARQKRLREGRAVLGRKAVLRVSAFDAPKTAEPRRQLRPALACKDITRRIAELLALADFRARYAAARERFRRGEHTVEFPAGTYRLRFLGAYCAPYSAPAAAA